MKSIVIFGGAGFVGKHILCKISKLGYKIIVPYQKQTNEAKLKLLGEAGQIIPFHFTSLHEKRLKKIIEKSEICINLKTTWDNKKYSYHKSIFDFNVKLISILNNCNTAKKLIFFSGLGIDQSTNSLRDRAILDVEKHIKNNLRNSIIIRPSVIFGSNDTKNFHSLNTIIQHMPFIPLPYYGKFKWEPVFVEDLAYYIAERGLRKNKKKEISNVVGPETLSFCEILSKMEKYRKVKRIKIPIPDFYMIILKKLLALFISKHSIEAIFSSFSDKVFHGDKVRLSTKFGDFLRATESVQI